MAFLPERYEDGLMEKVPLVTSTTCVKGDALVDGGAGLLQRATSSSTHIPYVAMEAATTSAAGTEILAIPTANRTRFIADTAASPVATDRYTLADLTDHDTLNESTSSVDVFFIEKIVGAASDKKVSGYFAGPESTVS